MSGHHHHRDTVHKPGESGITEPGPRGWYDRGYLPHLDGDLVTQAVTFRLADSLPRDSVERWKAELSHLPPGDARVRLRWRIEECLDSGLGASHLRDARIASIVRDNLLFFAGKRYELHAWVVMPNHVHALITPLEGVQLARIVHSWKSFTSKRANRILGTRGAFWQREFHDRFIRDEGHFLDVRGYIEENPVVAGLCSKREEWTFSSAHKGLEERRTPLCCRRAAGAPGRRTAVGDGHRGRERGIARCRRAAGAPGRRTGRLVRPAPA